MEIFILIFTYCYLFKNREENQWLLSKSSPLSSTKGCYNYAFIPIKFIIMQLFLFKCISWERCLGPLRVKRPLFRLKIASLQPATVSSINFPFYYENISGWLFSQQKKSRVNSLLSLAKHIPAKEVCIFQCQPTNLNQDKFQRAATMIFFFNLLLVLVDCQWNIYLTSVAFSMSLNWRACCSAGW